MPSNATQVGLIVYLAHVGSFVPAAAATIGQTDRLLTRIVSQEQLALGQSTFMTDLLQVSQRAVTGWSKHGARPLPGCLCGGTL